MEGEDVSAMSELCNAMAQEFRAYIIRRRQQKDLAGVRSDQIEAVQTSEEEVAAQLLRRGYKDLGLDHHVLSKEDLGNVMYNIDCAQLTVRGTAYDAAALYDELVRFYPAEGGRLHFARVMNQRIAEKIALVQRHELVPVMMTPELHASIISAFTDLRSVGAVDATERKLHQLEKLLIMHGSILGNSHHEYCTDWVEKVLLPNVKNKTDMDVVNASLSVCAELLHEKSPWLKQCVMELMKRSFQNENQTCSGPMSPAVFFARACKADAVTTVAACLETVPTRQRIAKPRVSFQALASHCTEETLVANLPGILMLLELDASVKSSRRWLEVGAAFGTLRERLGHSHLQEGLLTHVKDVPLFMSLLHEAETLVARAAADSTQAVELRDLLRKCARDVRRTLREPPQENAPLQRVSAIRKRRFPPPKNLHTQPAEVTSSTSV